MDKFVLNIKIIDLNFETQKLVESNYSKKLLFFDKDKCVVDVWGGPETILKTNINKAIVDPTACFGNNIRFIIQYIDLTEFQAKQKIQELVEVQVGYHKEKSQQIKIIWNNNQPINLNI